MRAENRFQLFPHPALLLQASYGAGKIPRLKSFEIARSLPHPNEMYRKIEFLSDRNENAPACGSVELGHHKARDPGDAAKNLDLIDRVLADCRIEDEKNGVRRFGIGLLHHAYDFFEFGHELGPVLQASRGIHQHNVRTTFPRGLHRIESERRGIAALFARNHGAIEALAPDA